MFTGIVGAVGSVAEATPGGAGLRVRVASGDLDLSDVVLGDSIAVNGVCLTVVGLDAGTFEADVSRETLACTAGFAVGDRVNLEKALRLADRLGGHLVTGHVDGVGRVSRFEPVGDNRLLAVSGPPDLAKYLARKGSVAVNGVSLTINEVSGSEFTVNLIPHTLSATNLGAARTGDGVNLEVDMLARYVERLHELR
ncbi:MAG: riboflavin synthase subunit alpha [Betaproteobacteria bacterium SG8_41]|nr:MAG: riboflavin synthase subunit alpha [Betaproteobacteria bacterium SG8_41]